MGVGVPDKVMVALSDRRISLLLDYQGTRPVSWSNPVRPLPQS